MTELIVEVEEVAADIPQSDLNPPALIASLLFVSPRPLNLEVLAEASGLESSMVEETIQNLQELFQDEVHGFSLHEVAGGYQLRTAVAAAPAVKRLFPPRVRRISKAAAETLAIVAYKQPVERSEIDTIRGVDSLPTLRTLLDAKLVRIIGNQDAPGKPALYGTTNTFLERFGLRDLADLPNLRELEQLLNEPGDFPDTPEELEA